MARKWTPPASRQPLLIEGYASVFGRADRCGDVVRAGAFARSLRARPPAMLLQHQSGAVAGRWVRISETGFGLFVRGLVDSESAARLVQDGLDGLSIGFRPRLWTPRAEGGRVLIDVDLIEISLVADPMQPAARFEHI
ncbi:MAG: HK97 family phage prohead protease [Henriciella sp.]|nr:HK97 family phage prohead protease [Henriciella sp.]